MERFKSFPDKHSRYNWSKDQIEKLRSMVADYVETGEYLNQLKLDSQTTIRSLLNFNRWVDSMAKHPNGGACPEYLPIHFEGKIAPAILALFEPKPVATPLQTEGQDASLSDDVKYVRDHVKRISEVPVLSDQEKMLLVITQARERIERFSHDKCIVLKGIKNVVPCSFVTQHLNELVALVDPDGLLAPPIQRQSAHNEYFYLLRTKDVND